jgi:hypothetical protein
LIAASQGDALAALFAASPIVDPDRAVFNPCVQGVRRPMPPHVSQSQISKFTACRRKWYIDKILGIKEPETNALAFGKEFHAVVENYVKNGIPFPATRAGRIAAAGVTLLPPPKSADVRTELDVSVPVGPIPFIGVIDQFEWVTDNAGAWYPAITDQKTTADPKYADTPETLAVDLQLNAYGKWVLRQWPNVSAVRFRKNFFLKDLKRAKAWAVETWVTPSQINDVCAAMERTIYAMIETATLDEAAVTMNKENCANFGGCKYAGRCLTPSENLDVLFQIEDARKSPKGKTPVTATTATPATPGFDREAFLRNIGQQQPAAVASPAAALPPPAAPQSVPVANATDPFTLKLINSLQETQIRALAAELIPAGVGATRATVQIVDALKAHFNGDHGSMLDAWIGYARGKFPANAAPINPPESSIARPAEEVAAGRATKTDGKKTRSTAKNDNETELRAVLRECGLREVRIMIDGDKAPSATTPYQSIRDALKQGAKPALGVCVNACAEEYDARGLNAAAVRDWSKAGLAPAVQQSPAPVVVQARVAEAAAARGVELANVSVVQSHGILTSEASRIDAALNALDDPRFGFLFWNQSPATKRFAAFAASVRAGTPTHRDQCVHELIADYVGSTAEGVGHGVKSYAAAVTLWHSICAGQGVDPAALGIPAIAQIADVFAPSASPQIPPAIVAHVEAPSPDPLAEIGNVPAYDDAEAAPPIVAPQLPPALPPSTFAPAPSSVDYGETKAPPAAHVASVTDGATRGQKIAALLRQLADVLESDA